MIIKLSQIASIYSCYEKKEGILSLDNIHIRVLQDNFKDLFYFVERDTEVQNNILFFIYMLTVLVLSVD